MALFSVIGDAFVARILKQVAHDYKLDYEEMKSRYCGKSSYEHFDVPKVVPSVPKVTIDLEKVPSVPKAPEVPKIPSGPVVPKAPVDPIESLTTSMSSLAVVPSSSESVVLPLSKMKKRDLELELERRGLCPDGTIPELKERVKQARLLEPSVKKARKPKDPNAPKKERKPKAPSESGEEKKRGRPPKTPSPPSSPVKPVVVPPKPVKPVEVEEEEEDDSASSESDFEREFDEEDETSGTQMDRLRAILASAGECEEEEFEDEE